MFSTQKYLRLLNLSWQNGFVYRTSVVMWRLRQFLGSLMALTVWQVLFSSQTEIFAYSESQMISYIFVVNVLQSVVLTTIMHGLAADIYHGKISSILLKPINLIAYLATTDIADKLKNIAFVIVETLILAALFQPTLTWPHPINALVFLFALIIGVTLYFLVQLLFGSLGFWSPETWAPRFIFFMLLNFTAGKLFPLDILPNWIQSILYLTPFPYLSYFQTQLFLNRVSGTTTWQQLMVAGGWVIILTILVTLVWKKGIKEYSAVGQ